MMLCHFTWPLAFFNEFDPHTLFKVVFVAFVLSIVMSQTLSFSIEMINMKVPNGDEGHYVFTEDRKVKKQTCTSFDFPTDFVNLESWAFLGE